MSLAFWIRRFLLVFTSTFVFIATVQYFKGHSIAAALLQALTWAAISAAIFTASRYFQARQIQRYPVYDDTPCDDTAKMPDNNENQSH